MPDTRFNEYVRLLDDPDLDIAIKRDRVRSWDDLFLAMNKVGFMKQDVRDHIHEEEERGNLNLSRALKAAVNRSKTFDQMDT